MKTYFIFFGNVLITKKRGNAASKYLGNDESVPVRVGVIMTARLYQKYGFLIFFQATKSK
ncbi:MAG: hypothetical protein ACD_36C00062G0001 [uncultured bacterium]|nr:MAG: hypothetical protein ACD_36C00062G0001 [uncultured bacterium]